MGLAKVILEREAAQLRPAIVFFHRQLTRKLKLLCKGIYSIYSINSSELEDLWESGTCCDACDACDTADWLPSLAQHAASLIYQLQFTARDFALLNPRVCA